MAPADRLTSRLINNSRVVLGGAVVLLVCVCAYATATVEFNSTCYERVNSTAAMLLEHSSLPLFSFNRVTSNNCALRTLDVAFTTNNTGTYSISMRGTLGNYGSNWTPLRLNTSSLHLADPVYRSPSMANGIMDSRIYQCNGFCSDFRCCFFLESKWYNFWTFQLSSVSLSGNNTYYFRITLQLNETVVNASNPITTSVAGAILPETECLHPKQVIEESNLQTVNVTELTSSSVYSFRFNGSHHKSLQTRVILRRPLSDDQIVMDALFIFPGRNLSSLMTGETCLLGQVQSSTVSQAGPSSLSVYQGFSMENTEHLIVIVPHQPSSPSSPLSLQFATVSFYRYNGIPFQDAQYYGNSFQVEDRTRLNGDSVGCTLGQYRFLFVWAVDQDENVARSLGGIVPRRYYRLNVEPLDEDDQNLTFGVSEYYGFSCSSTGTIRTANQEWLVGVVESNSASARFRLSLSTESDCFLLRYFCIPNTYLTGFVVSPLAGLLFGVNPYTSFASSESATIIFAAIIGLTIFAGITLSGNIGNDPDRILWIAGMLIALLFFVGYFPGIALRVLRRSIPVYDLETDSIVPFFTSKYARYFRCLRKHTYPYAGDCVPLIISWRWDISNVKEFRDSFTLQLCFHRAKALGFRYLMLDVVSLDQSSVDASKVMYFVDAYSYLPVLVGIESEYSRNMYVSRFWTNVEMLRYRDNTKVYTLKDTIEKPEAIGSALEEILTSKGCLATYNLDRLRVALLGLPFAAQVAFFPLRIIQMLAVNKVDLDIDVVNRVQRVAFPLHIMLESSAFDTIVRPIYVLTPFTFLLWGLLLVLPPIPIYCRHSLTRFDVAALVIVYALTLAWFLSFFLHGGEFALFWMALSCLGVLPSRMLVIFMLSNLILPLMLGFEFQAFRRKHDQSLTPHNKG